MGTKESRLAACAACLRAAIPQKISTRLVLILKPITLSSNHNTCAVERMNMLESQLIANDTTACQEKEGSVQYP